MPHAGSKGQVIYGALVGDVRQRATAAAASTAGSLEFGVSTIQNSTAVAAATYALPTPVVGAQVDLFVAAYSTAGTDSLSVTAPSGAKINDGTTPLEDTVSFDAAGQFVQLRAISATEYVVIGKSTGLTFST